MVSYTPVEHDPFAAGGTPKGYRLIPIDHNPFDVVAHQNSVSDSMVPSPQAPTNAVAPQGRFGDVLKPWLGGHNPIAETADLVWPDINEEDQAFRDKRGLGERAIDTATFAGSLPVRIATRGEYGLGDLVGSVVPSAGDSIGQAESDFARANAPMLKTMGALGEVSAGLPLGTGQAGKQLAPPRVKAQPAPVAPYTNRVGEMATAAERDLRAFENQNVRPFGPAFSQGPMAAAAKQLSEIPFVGQPVRAALEESITGLRDRVGSLADDIAPAATHEVAGFRVQSGLERFRNSRLADLEPSVTTDVGAPATRQVQSATQMSAGAVRDANAAAPIRAAANPQTQTTRGVQTPALRPLTGQITRRTQASDLDDAQLANYIRRPVDETSFASRQEALYERADRMIPDMRRINGTDNPDMINARNTRAALTGIDRNIANDISGAHGRITGDLAERIRRAQSGNFQFDDLRAMRTEIGRALGNTNPMQQTLNRTHLKTLYSALSRDIEVGLETLANRALVRSRQGGNAGNRVSAQDAERAVGALRAFRVADRYNRMGMENIDRVTKLIGAENATDAAKTLVRAALDGDKGNTRQFRTAMSSLRPEERNTFSSLILRHLGAPDPGMRGLSQDIQFSVSKFLTRWNALSPDARAMLFGGEHRGSINEIVRIASRLANVEALANTSRSATNALGLGSMVAGTGAAAVGGAAGLFSTIMIPGSFSLLMSRPAYARWAVKYARLRQTNLRTPGGAQARMKTHINKLKELAKFDPQLTAIAAGVVAENEEN